jgi:Lipoprotein LpqB beta-propeller domain/Sporulation and spore germination
MSTVVRRSRRTTTALLVAAGALIVSTGCANIPVTSAPQVIPQSVPAAAPAAGGDLRYDGIVPRRGESPEDIVRDFLRAGGSIERAHTRARAYLTAAASKKWNDNAGAVIIDNSFYLDARQGGSVVLLSAQRHGRVNDDGSYVPGEGPSPYTFRLTKVDGEWRIDNPPPGLLIELSTFESAFRAYQVYFLNATRTKVVPDVRWYSAPPDSLATLLVTALERGPSKWLEDAVQSDLAGVTLRTNIVQERDRVKVNLTGLGDQADTLTAGGFAQLVWTLSQLGVGGVEVYADGQLIKPAGAPDLTLQQLSDWRGFDPNGLSVNASGYFIRDGAVWTTKDAPLAGPAGRTTFRAVSVAASVDERSVAVVRRTAAGGRALYVGAPGSPRLTISGTTLTRPTWGPETREVWTVRDGRDVVLVTLDGHASRIDVPQEQEIGPIRALSLSRDGVRVAVVAGLPGRERLWVGVVLRDNGATQIQGLRWLDFGDTPVSDVSWSDAGTVIALTRSGEQDSSLYSVDVDGGTPALLVSTTGLPGPPRAIAAGPTLLTIAAGTLWRTPVASESWTRVEDRRGGESAPAYPG